ncbi:MAG: ECF transporter S component [Clostridia bacterium]|nr:ECF transporter S component [Clostridia bacterium]
MSKKTLFITRTAAMLALLIVLQAATKNLGQFVTGSCVNAVLAAATLLGGFASGLIVAVVSPFLAFLLGIGPKLIEVVPAIAIGNLALVLILWAIKGDGALNRVIKWIAASVGKFLVLYLLVIQLLCRVMTLPDKMTATFSTMFSWPQLVTALIGSGIMLLILPILQKAIRKA